MSFTNGALDSSPIALPKIKPNTNIPTTTRQARQHYPTLDEVASRGVKRTASKAALLTPPSIARVKKPRAKSLDADEGTSDDDEEEGVVDEVEDTLKRRRDAIAKTRARSLDDERYSLPAPLSPPVSSRRVTTERKRAFVQPPPPLFDTPSPRVGHDPRQDEENPFLATPAIIKRNKAIKRVDPNDIYARLPVDQHGEKPVMHMLYKGRSIACRNSLYNAPPKPQELLPITHPNYSPPRRLKPRKLFAKEIAALPSSRKTSTVATTTAEDDPFAVPAPRRSSR